MYFSFSSIRYNVEQSLTMAIHSPFSTIPLVTLLIFHLFFISFSPFSNAVFLMFQFLFISTHTRANPDLRDIFPITDNSSCYIAHISPTVSHFPPSAIHCSINVSVSPLIGVRHSRYILYCSQFLSSHCLSFTYCI